MPNTGQEPPQEASLTAAALETILSDMWKSDPWGNKTVKKVEPLQVKSKNFHRIYAEVIEQGALDQFESAMNQPFTVQGALMPDAHAGYTLPIGAVIATDSVILPAWVGYDIGCGMCAVKTTFSEDDIRAHAKDIFDDIYKAVPVGFNHNQSPTEWKNGKELPKTEVTRTIFEKNGLLQLGSLGGGNHFIEIGVDNSPEKAIWIILHSGSRGIGHAVATHYMKTASDTGKASEGHFGFKITSKHGKNYVTDLNFCLEFALENRFEMIRRVNLVIAKYCDGFADWNTLINRNHNHAEIINSLVVIHRKGATHAKEGMMGVIPGNMRDGSFIVRGLGNGYSLSSSSHGAGRVLGRKKAQDTLDMKDFEAVMKGVTAKVTPETIDESPFAYKDIFEVMKLQKDLVTVVTHVLPIINIKG